MGIGRFDCLLANGVEVRVIESIKAGQKLSEARFAPSPGGIISSSSSNRGRVGVPVGQKSVYDMFTKSTATRNNEDIG